MYPILDLEDIQMHLAPTGGWVTLGLRERDHSQLGDVEKLKWYGSFESGNQTTGTFLFDTIKTCIALL